MSLQADGKVAFEDVPVFGVYRPACHDSSLYLFVLVIFLEDVMLSQVHISRAIQLMSTHSSIDFLIIVILKCGSRVSVS